MHPSLEAFALAAGLLALGAALVHRFGFPPLPVYLLTGLVVGERLPVEDLEPLPSLGLLLLLFSVGLEFGPDRLRELSGKALRAGFFDALALPLGFLLGLLAGLDLRGALLLAGVIYISSSAVIVKLIIDLRRAANPESEVVLGVLVLEDLVIALLLALLGGQGPVGFLGGVALALAYFLFARFLGPRLVRFMEGLSDELVLLLGAAFTAGTALLFHAVGASEGVGAFLSGVIAAGLGLRERLEHLFGPVRDLGVALFFLVVGAEALGLLRGLTPWAVGLVLLGLLLKLPLNHLGGARAGLGRKRRLYSALYLVPRGEFNLVLGALALGQGYPLVAQVAVLLVLVSIPLGALLIRYAPEIAQALYPEARPRKRTKRAEGSPVE
ncbi:sodium:proton antiporter [Thermus thermophilus]|uniref:Sodium:proton antiporter n=1 Tax=Thermus thermophilus TaxID=274 RepID=A0AAD1KUY9_THETH|nr:cation:proton antiporter [Thermus thermophilus]BBL82749.1 sodium:proton antiporter [Thermus thermophilus]BBL85048.1 sodium:proton antiporter [Thermus thermophilus]BCZ87410.1 sodium:proton antiporter [Thermus thermophilus]BCZ89768.1 sodium:proton antiporter [Thermus thermophilus]BCZ92428.1 sodium:proton antiporter [Thermus thermophilus]